MRGQSQPFSTGKSGKEIRSSKWIWWGLEDIKVEEFLRNISYRFVRTTPACLLFYWNIHFSLVLENIVFRPVSAGQDFFIKFASGYKTCFGHHIMVYDN